MQLGDVAQIRTGLILSRKQAKMDFEIKSTYKLLSLNNIDEDGMFIDENFQIFSSSDHLDEHYFTEKGDVIFRLSYPYTAVYIDQDHSNLLIPSYFAIIKVNKKQILPKFISWYLNTQSIKNELERAQAGTRILSTNQQTLKNLAIEVPTLSKQKALIEMYELHLREKQLYSKLIKEKEKYFQGFIQQILGGESND